MPGIPLSFQHFNAFLGDHEGATAVVLADVFGSGGSRNVYIDKMGRVRRILGYQLQNGAQPMHFFDYAFARHLVVIKKSGTLDPTTGVAPVSRQLMALFEDTTLTDPGLGGLWYSNDFGVTWVYTDAMLTFPYRTNVDFDFAQFGDTLYIAIPHYYLGTVRKWNGTSLSDAGRTQSPTITPTLSASAGLLDGHYTWKLVSMIGNTRGAASLPATELSVQNKQATLAWSADANTSVTGYELYRTSGIGNIYYFVTYLDGRGTVAYTDNNSDLTILENRALQEHGDKPPCVKFCEVHKSRMWYAYVTGFDTSFGFGPSITNPAEYPTRIYWSDPNLPEDVNQFNYVDLADSENSGDPISGLFGNFDGQLVVFTERAVWLISGTGNIIGNIQDWNVTKSDAQVGSVSVNTVVKVPIGARYPNKDGQMQETKVETLAYMTPFNDIRLFNGIADEIISYPKLDVIGSANYATRSHSLAVHDVKRGEIAWIFAASDSLSNDTCVVWNYHWGVWYDRDWPFGGVAVVESDGDSDVILAISTNAQLTGDCFKLWTGHKNGSADMSAQWTSKKIYGLGQDGAPLFSNRKRWRWADFIFDNDNAVDVNLLVETENAETTAFINISPDTVNILTANGSGILANGKNIVCESSLVSQQVGLEDTSSKYPTDEWVRFTLGDGTANHPQPEGQWTVEALNVAYQVLPGLERRFQ